MTTNELLDYARALNASKRVLQLIRDGYWTRLRCEVDRCVFDSREFTTPKTDRDSSISIDHLVPKAYGGSNDPHNLLPAHRLCNTLKADHIPDIPLPEILDRCERRPGYLRSA